MNRRIQAICILSYRLFSNWTTLRLEEFYLPPLDQQRRIAAILWAADDALQQNLGLLKACNQTLLTAFDTHTGVNSRSESPLVELQDVVARFIDYRGKTPKKTTEGVPLITAKNVREGYLSEEPREYIAAEDYETWMRRGIPAQTDILFTTEAPMGNAARVPSYRFALAQRIICLVPDETKVNPAFLFWGMQSSAIQNRIRQKASGTTVLGIKQSNLRKVLFPLPDLSMQRETASLCDALAATRVEIEPQRLKFGGQKLNL